MANDGTGAFWDETDPADSALLKDGAKQIRDLRIGLKTRVNYEHTTPAGASAGGVHRAGSANAYNGAGTPANLPDGVTALGVAHKGRLWFDETVGLLRGWDGAAWQLIRSRVAFLQDQQAAGTNGGAATVAWSTRTLNTIVKNLDGFVTALAANAFTLSPGNYFIEASAPGLACNQHQIRLYNVTDAAIEAVGTMEYSGSTGSFAQTRSQVKAAFNITAAKQYRIEHIAQQVGTVAGAGFGYGNAVAFGVNTVFTEVSIIKTAGPAL